MPRAASVRKFSHTLDAGDCSGGQAHVDMPNPTAARIMPGNQARELPAPARQSRRTLPSGSAVLGSNA
ncbi:MAG: hypothetical protein N2379_00735 [Verrucomicrobiae bacterium]|nr:hypothetical protein [Verrucomicrobiae bacterium]